MLGMLEAARGCLKEELQLDIISNNLANAAVSGFKRDRISFQNLLMDKVNQPQNYYTPYSASLVNIKTDFAPGDIRATGNPLDVAISGRGFFKVMTTEGIRYTRKGSFALDRDGNLITQEGFQVLGRSGVINTGGKTVEIDKTGRILIDGGEVDRLDIVDFEDTSSLRKIGGTLFEKDIKVPEIPVPPETTVRQGYLEDSNVNVAEEMVRMIQSLRSFESYQKAIKLLDRLDHKASNDVGRVR